MKLFILVSYFISFNLLSGTPEKGDIDFKLDGKYKNLVHPKESILKNLPDSSDVEAMIELQTPVKTQGNRGTCTIFSTTAHLEAIYMMLYKPNTYPDFSEEWLQFINIANREDIGEGSNTPRNIFLSMKHGLVNEKDWRYDPNDWTEYPKTSPQFRYCNKIHKEDIPLKRCLLAHGDPNLILGESDTLRKDHQKFVQLADTAKVLKQDFLLKHFVKNIRSLTTVGQIKYLLASGTPITLGIDFYYGSWNHRKSDEFGIGRDLNAFDNGFVSYPEIGSVDRIESEKKGSGHAVLVVGYDDNIVITSKIKMTNGEYKQFKYRGAYIIKNSWGTESLGKDFMYKGKKYPGYAYITYKYAHQFGGFFDLPYSR